MEFALSLINWKSASAEFLTSLHPFDMSENALAGESATCAGEDPDGVVLCGMKLFIIDSESFQRRKFLGIVLLLLL